MSIVSDILDKEIEAVRTHKIQWVTDNPNNPDAPHIIVFFRDAEQVAVAGTPPTREHTLETLRLGIFGFTADQVMFSLETYGSSLNENPVTGKPWEQGEMGVVYKEYPEYSARGEVYESLEVLCYDREGNWARYALKYYIRSNEVVWLGEDAVDSENHDVTVVRGYIHDEVTSYFAERTMETAVEDEVENLNFDPETRDLLEKSKTDPKLRLIREVAEDSATLTMLYVKAKVLSAALIAKPGSDRQIQIDSRGSSLLKLMRDLGVPVDKTP